MLASCTLCDRQAPMLLPIERLGRACPACLRRLGELAGSGALDELLLGPTTASAPEPSADADAYEAEFLKQNAEGEPQPPAEAGAFQLEAADVFAEFKRNVHRVVRPEDAQTHYDLGIAYREMGMRRDALREWGVVLAHAKSLELLEGAARFAFQAFDLARLPALRARLFPG